MQKYITVGLLCMLMSFVKYCGIEKGLSAAEISKNAGNHHSPEQHFYVSDFGALPDGKTINTKTMQYAIDACHLAGGGIVYCGPGRYVTGSLMLKSNVEFHLANGCTIIGSTSLTDYYELMADGFRGKNAPEGSSKSLFFAIEAENIAITGSGEINGSGLAFYNTDDFAGRFFRKPNTARPRIVTFYKCRNVRFEGVDYIDSSCWTFWLMKCERVSIHRVKISGDQRMINNDGIDLDSCRDVTVSDCSFKTGDDCLILRSISQVFDTPGICENIAITNCTLDSWCQGIRVGCPGDNVIRNCTFSNLVINSAGNGIVFVNPKRYLPKDSSVRADIHDILFSDIIIDCAGSPITLLVENGITLQRLSDLSFSHFRVRSGLPIQVEGCPETIIRNVSFNDMGITTSGENAIICHFCEDIKFDNMELSNIPDTGLGK
ncbi:MAG: right-handed parallel beta-helix repeat-containing protein [Candidatus Latescibacteria bacterium]|nr:right-handed parallel beta-helix repeat-containing protein [Candidatus Latescibacterota bacterium]